MATDLERLVIRLEANATQVEKAFGKVDERLGKMNQALGRVQQRVNSGFSSMERSASSLSGVYATLGSAVTGSTLAKAADGWQQLANRLTAVGVPAEKVAETQERIFAVAQRSAAPLSETGELFARLTRSTKELGVSQDEVLVATETISKAMKIGGASAQEASAAMLQLGQALGSGRLQGDELRSILENAPVLAELLATEFGVAVGELKKLGEDGELVTARVFKAIAAGSREIEAAFAQTIPTIADGWTRLVSALDAYIGRQSAATGAGRLVSDSLTGLAANIDSVVQAFLYLGSIALARSFTPAAAAAGAAVLSMARNVAAAQVTLAATSATAGRLGVALLGAFGGPVGVALTALAAGTVYLATRTNDAEKAANEHKEALSALNDVIGLARGGVVGLEGKLEDLAGLHIKAAEAAYEQAAAEEELLSKLRDYANSGPLPAFGEDAALAGAGAANANEVAAAAGERRRAAGERLAALRAKLEEGRNVIRASGLPTPPSRPGDFGGGSGGAGSGGNAFEREIEQIRRRTRELENEAAVVGRSSFETDKARTAFDLLEAAKESNVEITPELKAQIDEIAGAYGAAKEKLDEMNASQEAFRDLQQFIGQSLSGFFSDIVSGGKNAGDALMNLTKKLADAAFQAVLLGQGPLAGLFGTKAAGDAVGGLFGAIFDGFRAEGGPVSAGKAYVVGERGPELMVPGRSGFVVPNDVLASGGRGGSGGSTVIVNQTFTADANPRELASMAAMIKADTMRAVKDAQARGR